MEKQRILSRRQFLGLSGLSILGMGLYSGEIARHEIDIVQRTIRLDGLPDAFKGFRIVQISDIHYQKFTEEFFLKLVLHDVNALKADLVLLTGDFISTPREKSDIPVTWAYECSEVLTRIECQQRYAILGNHDCEVNEPAITDALETHRIPVLNNKSVALERDGKRIWLAGLADWLNGKERPNYEKSIPKGVRTDGNPVILMAHEPDSATEAVKHGVDLMLSGHTHGGQVRMPFVPPVYLPPMGKKYIQGHFQLGPMQLYVNRGIGTVGVPFRLNCPPEITVLTLT
ncbi:metallophosphoesterase [Acidobacterium sp. S8]|uniref:metallophosphoesterase n=1 Tax=Acidobacterium sp. S8 TaxID=1641854 RepID=UPI0020B12758|nr:metallophosphoesterase [Acidobacterium sp. S8]